jgi:Tfp pilus assembly protein PilF
MNPLIKILCLILLFGGILKSENEFKEREHFYNAIKYYNEGDYKKAEKECRMAIKINPNNAKSHHLLGKILFERKRYDEAEKELREAIKIDSTYAEAHNNLGTLLEILKRYDEAEKEYREV